MLAAAEFDATSNSDPFLQQDSRVPRKLVIRLKIKFRSDFNAGCDLEISRSNSIKILCHDSESRYEQLDYAIKCNWKYIDCVGI